MTVVSLSSRHHYSPFSIRSSDKDFLLYVFCAVLRGLSRSSISYGVAVAVPFAKKEGCHVQRGAGFVVEPCVCLCAFISLFSLTTSGLHSYCIVNLLNI